MIETLLDAIALVLKETGDPESPYWLASQMDEMRLWKASETDIRAALEEDIVKFGEHSRFVKTLNCEFALRSWIAGQE